jgi:hypothetical protein
MDLIIRDYAQLSLLLEPPPLRPVDSPPPFSRAHPSHLLEHGPVVRKRLASRIEDLVGRRQTALESYGSIRHQVTGISRTVRRREPAR